MVSHRPFDVRFDSKMAGRLYTMYSYVALQFLRDLRAAKATICGEHHWSPGYSL
jgi:hypothetical protein